MLHFADISSYYIQSACIYREEHVETDCLNIVIHCIFLVTTLYAILITSTNKFNLQLL
jgi:hypothetical protein